VHLVKQLTLSKTEYKKQKITEVRLLKESSDKYHVLVFTGEKGGRLRERSLTPFGEPLEKAEQRFEETITLTERRGYLQSSEEVTPQDEDTTTETIEDSIIPSSPKFQLHPKTKAKIDAVRSRLEFPNEIRKTKWPLSRVLWRAGQLKTPELQSLLKPLLPELNELEANCATWALAKNPDLDSVQLIQELSYKFPDSLSIQRYLSASKSITDDGYDKTVAFEALPEIPDDEKLSYLLSESFTSDESSLSLVPFFYYSPAWRDSIVRFTEKAPIAKNYFRLIRALFKLAELSCDSQIYGILSTRFETSKPQVIREWKQVNKRWEIITKGVFSSKSKHYLRKRVRKNLQRLGEDYDIEEFITLAMGVLLSIDKETTEHPEPVRSGYLWDSTSRTGTMVNSYAPTYGHLHAFTWLTLSSCQTLRMNRGLTYRYDSGVNPSDLTKHARHEPFGELWDQAPDAVIHLLCHSSIQEVHNFAHAIWLANPNFKNEIEVEHIILFIQSEIDDTKELGISLAKSFWNPSQPNFELIKALIHSGNTTAEQLVLDWISETKTALATQPDLIASLFTAGSTTVHERLIGIFLNQLTSEENIIENVVTELLNNENRSADLAYKSLQTLLPNCFDKLSEDSLIKLLESSQENHQLLATDIIASQLAKSVSVSGKIWIKPIDSEFTSVRSKGVNLLQLLPSKLLEENIDLIASCCRSPHPEIRQGVGKSLSLIASSHPHLAKEILLELYPLVIRKEEAIGVHADTINLIRNHLCSYLSEIPDEYTPQLLESDHSAAQELGFIKLQDSNNLNAELIPQLIAWANHPHAELRQWIIKYLSENPNRLLMQLDEITPLVESDWDETREFSFNFLRNQVPEDKWDVDSLIKLCDSIKPTVQDFGKEMITRRFREEDGELYLTKLSQHPTREMQFFVTHFLEQHATDSTSIILKLEHFFQTALSAVHTARVSKSKVQQFLLKEALKKEAVATMAHKLFHHHAVTCAIEDKAICISSLARLEAQHTHLKKQLTVVEPKPWKAN